MRRLQAVFAAWFRVLALGVVLSAGLPATLPAAALPAPVNLIPNTMGWQDELVDKLGDVGPGVSIALDPSGHAHMAYYDISNDNLKFAAWDGVAWTIDTVERNLGSGGLHFFDLFSTSVAVYGNTNYIAYIKWDVATGRSMIRLATGGPGGWTLSTIATAVDVNSPVYAPSLRMDHNRSLHTTFTRSDELFTHDVIYARFDVTGTAWAVQTVDTVRVDSAGAKIITSLALDANNHPQIAYAGHEVLYAAPLRWARWNAGNWITQTVSLTTTALIPADSPSVAVDSAGLPGIAFEDPQDFPFARISYVNFDGSQWHLASPISNTFSAPSLAIQYPNQPRIAALAANGAAYAQWDGAAWHTQDITGTQGSPGDVALALDTGGNAHLGYYDTDYGDLHALTWASNWQTQTVTLSGSAPSLAVDSHNLPFVSYTDSASTVHLAQWKPGGYWQYQNVAPHAYYDSLRLQYDVNRQPLPIISYADLADVAHPHLGYAQWNGAAFVTQTVDSADGVGDWSSLAFDYRASPIIGYYDAAHQRIKYAVASSQGGTGWTVNTDLAGPPVHNPWLASSGSPLCCQSYVAYVDSTSLALRLATWDGSHWTDELVDGGGSDHIVYVSLAVDRTTGEPALAYFDLTHGIVKYAFRSAGSWTRVPVDSSPGNVSGLSLALALYSNEYPRIAYNASADNSVRLAWTTSPTSTWTLETVGSFGNLSSANLSSQAQTRDYVAVDQVAPTVVYAFRSATLPYSIYFNPLQPCVESQPDLAAAGPTLAYVRTLAPADLAQVDDLTTLRALRDLFALSPGGRYYINLYYLHAPEAGALALHNPALLWDAYRTLENWLPGFLALTVGHGDQQIITQAMVDQVNNIADRLAAAGSPALGTAINLERAKYNHLQAFVGKTFQQGANLLNIPVNAVYLPIVRR